MRGSWSIGKFSLAEATALYNGLQHLIENGGDLESLELVGKHPSENELATFDINPDLPVFLSVRESPDLSDIYIQYLRACNTYFSNLYK